MLLGAELLPEADEEGDAGSACGSDPSNDFYAEAAHLDDGLRAGAGMQEEEVFEKEDELSQ